MICELCKQEIRHDERGGYLESVMVYQIVDDRARLCRHEMLKGIPLREVHENCLKELLP